MGQVVSRISSIFGVGHGHEEGDHELQEGVNGLEMGSASYNHYQHCKQERGLYFGSHFMMGGERREMVKPEGFLFGENTELEKFGDKIYTFPYAPQQLIDPTQPLFLLVNIRKESIELVRLPSEEGNAQDLYQVKFVFDADQPCVVQIHFQARQVMLEDGIHFLYRNKANIAKSEKYHFESGADIHFDQFTFDAATVVTDTFTDPGERFYPLLISIHTADEKQLQTTAATLERESEKNQRLFLKSIRQQITVDGVVYLLQEIYGFQSRDCSICLGETRDTVILPCRHLCVCKGCAADLKEKHMNCPMCRAPFRALLELRGARKVCVADMNTCFPSPQPQSQTRWESFKLVEALQGPLREVPQSITMPPLEIYEEVPSRSKYGLKVVGKKTIEDPRETEEGIELSSVEYFQHRPLHSDHHEKPSPPQPETPTEEINEEKEEVANGTDEEEEQQDSVPDYKEKVRRNKVVTVVADPSSSDSQDSSNGLLQEKEKS